MITIRSENGPLGDFIYPLWQHRRFWGNLGQLQAHLLLETQLTTYLLAHVKMPNRQADTPTMCMAEGAVGSSSSHPVFSVTVPVLLLSLMRILTDVLDLGTRKQPACGGKEEYSDKILITGDSSFF